MCGLLFTSAVVILTGLALALDAAFFLCAECPLGHGQDEAGILILQLRLLPFFIMGGSGVELMRSAPERPGDNEGLA